jgi:hypothetical protein
VLAGSDQMNVGSRTPIRIGGVGALALLALLGCGQTPPKPTGAPQRSEESSLQPAHVSTAAEDPEYGPCLETSHDCVALNPDVSQKSIGETICVSGYTKSVRPLSSYTQGVKTKLLRESGIDVSRAGQYELDHIIPLALGGNPRRLSNLWLQPWDGPHGAHMKDILEVRLQRLVCAGQMPLLEAQFCIAEDWETCAERHPRN